MTDKRAASRDEGRTEVLERAASAIAEHGYHGMSMRDLARATGRGLATFYHLFASKEDILFELQLRAFQRLIASATPLLSVDGDAIDRLHAFITNHVRYFVEQPDVMRVLVQEASALPPKRRAEIRTLKRRYFEIGQALLRDVISRRSQASDPRELERATYCMFGMLNWIYGWYEPTRHGPPGVLAKTISNVTVCGATGSSIRELGTTPIAHESLLHSTGGPV
jgi:AcrR family transcriptional regulator